MFTFAPERDLAGAVGQKSISSSAVEAAGSRSSLSEAERNQEILRLSRSGVRDESLMSEFGLSRSSLRSLLLAARTQELLSRTVEFIDSEEFHRPRAESLICGPPPEASVEVSRVPSGLPAYVRELYRVPLLTKDQEQYYFRRMNFRKYQFVQLQDDLRREKPTLRLVSRMERLLADIDEIRDLLIRSNLRLVVSIAKRYLKAGAVFFELVSDGNVSLMRAVEKFDYSRGNKFSTYASWAILKNFARSVPAEYQRLDRFRTGQEEVFAQSSEERGSQFAAERVSRAHREIIGQLLEGLDGREQKVLACRFGLGEAEEPETLEQVGLRLGVTKERVRQIEVKTLEKLRRLVKCSSIEIPGF